MNDALMVAIVTAAASLIVGVLAAVLSYQAAVRAAASREHAEVKAAEADQSAQAIKAEHDLIDQLQEELAAHRAEQARRTAALEARVRVLEEDKATMRRYAYDLRSHIFDGKPPPPPPWPEGLDR